MEQNCVMNPTRLYSLTFLLETYIQGNSWKKCCMFAVEQWVPECFLYMFLT
uniref:Alternative protein C4orf41 n=1 Tax=Homo sapiens TaxID=9606 RepID=L8ECJ4_HUMAN|nr:alternative protein C4orf41 [Homo sapiens]